MLRMIAAPESRCPLQTDLTLADFDPQPTLVTPAHSVTRARFPAIDAHVGCYAENLGWVAGMLDRYPNFNVDIGARLAELGRQPYTARRFFRDYADRIVFGLDGFPPTPQDYAPYFRFLETEDEYFPYAPSGQGGQGRWRIYGIGLPDDVLRRVYHDTAARLLGLRGS
jgi:predicted TIM-barrel fold metal-dependent hydrolase